MSIKVTGICKKYHKQEALKDVSFEVSSGKIVAILGPNGAGKSSLMRILSGINAADQGVVELFGKPFIAGDVVLQKEIGYLPENNPLYKDMYVLEFLNFCADLYKIENSKKIIQDTVLRVGLQSVENKLIRELSKGYKQRVGLAQALLHDPKILILDEPTSGLDPSQLMSIRELIKDLGKTKTILFSSHILQEVESICERIIFLNQGQIVADFEMDYWQQKFPEAKNLEEIFIQLSIKNN